MNNPVTTEKRQRPEKPHYKFSVLKVHVTPAVEDARELETILVTSLRALFGEWEHHSCQIKVQRVEESTFRVECLDSSVGAVRAALTMVTTPPYLDSTVYRLDVVDTDEEL